MNSLIFVLSVIVFLFAVVGIYKLFGKAGLFAYIGFATILANIQVCKSINFLGLTTTAGSVLYASTFLCTDILSEKYGKRTARAAVLLGICISLLWLLGTQITLWLKPSDSDTIQASLKALFGLVPRITLASLTGYIVSQSVDVVLYHGIWKKTGNSSKGLWIRNNGSTLVSQLVDTVIFVTIAFIGTVKWNVFFEIMGTTYLFKAIVAFCDTPFAYIARKLDPISEGGDLVCQEKLVN